MQVTQAEVLRLVDNDSVGVRYVDAALDDGRRDEDIVVIVDKAHDDTLQLFGRHLSVADTDTCIRDKTRDHRTQLFQVADAVVDKKDLTVAAHLEVDGLGDDFLVERVHFSLHRVTVGRRCLDDGHVTCPHKGELQRAGDGRGSHGERVDIDLQLLELLLHGDAELLFLVDDKQAEVLEMDVLADEPVRADEDVDLTLLQFLQDTAHVSRLACTAEVVDAAGEVLQTVAERAVVLVGKDSRGDKHSDLLVVTHGLERRTHGDFRLAEPDVTTHETVHRTVALHVGLHLLGRLELVGRILVEEARLQFVLEEGVGAEAESLLLATSCIEADEVAGNVLNLVLGLFLELLPGARAELVQAGRLAVTALVLGNLVQGMDGDEHLAPVLIDELDDLLRAVAVGDADEAGKASDAVVDMDHVVARLELVELLQREGHLAATCLVALEVILMETVEYLVVREEAGAEGMVSETLVERTVDRREGNVVAPLVEDGTQTVGLLHAVGQYINGVVLVKELPKHGGDHVEVLVEYGLHLRGETERSFGRTRRTGAELHATEIERTTGELLTGDCGREHDVVDPLLLGQRDSRLRGDRLGMHGSNLLCHPVIVLQPHHRVIRQEVEELHLTTSPARQLGDNGHALLPLLRELAVDLKRAYAVYLIAEEVDTVGILRGEGKHIEDASPNGILPRLIHIVHAFEAQARQPPCHLHQVCPAALLQRQRPFGQLTAGDHFLGQGLRVGHDAHGRSPVAQTAQGLGAEYLVGRILLPVLDGTAVGRREEEDIVVATDLRQVVIEITGLLEVVQNADKRMALLPDIRRDKQRGSRSA